MLTTYLYPSSVWRVLLSNSPHATTNTMTCYQFIQIQAVGNNLGFGSGCTCFNSPCTILIYFGRFLKVGYMTHFLQYWYGNPPGNISYHRTLLQGCQNHLSDYICRSVVGKSIVRRQFFNGILYYYYYIIILLYYYNVILLRNSITSLT